MGHMAVNYAAACILGAKLADRFQRSHFLSEYANDWIVSDYPLAGAAVYEVRPCLSRRSPTDAAHDLQLRRLAHS